MRPPRSQPLPSTRAPTKGGRRAGVAAWFGPPPPTHLDSHQHLHRDPLVGRVVAAVGSACPCGTRRRTSRNSGTFYGQDGKGTPYSEFVSVDARVRIVAGLPAGTTELGCHRGLLDGVPGYGAGRMVEAGALCDARVRPALAEHSVTLRSFVPPLTG